jgi:leucyl-tRNA synthetase
MIRYWGVPIPVIYCDTCGIQGVKEEDLPVLLPEVNDPKEVGGSLLANRKEFLETTCPKCGGKGRRETDTLDTFFDSSWYFLRFADPQNKEKVGFLLSIWL